MKKAGYVLIWLLLLGCSARQTSDKLDHEGSEDTVFLYQEKTAYSRQAIYIDPSNTSKRYEQMSMFNLTDYDRELFDLSYKLLTNNKPDVFRKVALQGLPTQWMPLYPYKQKFYLYAPCEWGYLGQRILSDSALIAKYSDGATPYPLESIEKVKPNKYQLKLVENGDERYKDCMIHVLDTVSFLSLWEYLNVDGQARYQLYIPKESMKKYQIIVNQCNEETDEFSFDEMNYDSLKVTNN